MVFIRVYYIKFPSQICYFPSKIRAFLLKALGPTAGYKEACAHGAAAHVLFRPGKARLQNPPEKSAKSPGKSRILLGNWI